MKHALILPRSLKHSTLKTVLELIKERKHGGVNGTKTTFVKAAIGLLRLNKTKLKEGGRLRIEPHLQLLTKAIPEINQEIVKLRKDADFEGFIQEPQRERRKRGRPKQTERNLQPTS